MTSINEAIFRGRIRHENSPALEPLQRQQSPLTKQIMARRAIEAVLAGGYTTSQAATQNTPPAPPRAIPHPPLSRDLVLWVVLFALAGLIGIATSRLPGHAVQAKLASRAALAPPAEMLPEAAPPRAAAPPQAAVQPPALAAAETAGVDIASAAPLAAPAASRATLLPVFKPAALLPVVPASPPPPRSEPLRVQPAGEVPRVPLAEVLYEGDPAPAAQSSRAALSAAAPPAAAARPRAQSAPAAAPATATTADDSAAPRVQGIFWDKVRPMALIGGDIVEVGSSVGAYKVTSIQPGLVVLSDGASHLDLRP